MQSKIMGITIVLLVAMVIALVSGIVVFALGSTLPAALGTGGTAFLAIAALGMGVLNYLMPNSPTAG
ncbi:hypothetical protein [Streptomyces sp. NPDC058424]|uniref:hypothetical protein n=1 Tax=Streptomyces sp. NPDC058424 TaxID=3346491 RepID=UPI0036526A5B